MKSALIIFTLAMCASVLGSEPGWVTELRKTHTTWQGRTLVLRSENPIPMLKGNTQSGLYHVPGCRYYTPESTSRTVWVRNVAEAASLGLTPCKLCSQTITAKE